MRGKRTLTAVCLFAAVWAVTAFSTPREAPAAAPTVTENPVGPGYPGSLTGAPGESGGSRSNGMETEGAGGRTNGTETEGAGSRTNGTGTKGAGSRTNGTEAEDERSRTNGTGTKSAGNRPNGTETEVVGSRTNGTDTEVSGSRTSSEPRAEEGTPAENPESPDQNEADIPSAPEWLTGQTDKVVAVRADSTSGSRALVTYYRKDRDWSEIFSVRGVIGKSGLAAADEKREGDKKTPAGVYSFIKAFGIKEDPGGALPYHQIQAGDYWVDDSSSQFYNRLVHEGSVEKDWSSGENLIQMAPWYNYCLALSYNEEQVPGKGSAIFLHAMRADDWGTSGCIGIPEDQIRLLVTEADSNTRIVIISDN